MTRDELRNEVAEAIGIDPAELKDDSTRDDIAEWDSIAVANIVAMLDEHIDGELEQEEIEALDGFQAIVDFARRRGALTR